jgi:N-methylhydantoinase A
MWSVGADIGGTFTDVVALSDRGQLKRVKVLTTYDAFTVGVAQGLAQCLDASEREAVVRLVHGTTVATNAILQEQRAPVGLITTRGFRDVLELRRARRPTLYDLSWVPPAPLAMREHRHEVSERIAFDGSVVQALEPSEIDRCVDALAEQALDAVAICLINAYANPIHEQLIVERVRQRLPQIKVTASSVIAAQIREYERASTTVVNAFLLPVVEDYVAELERELQALGVSAPLEIMQSDGTTAPGTLIAERPFLMIESGPAAGAIAAARLAQELERRSVVAFDMGGTTAKATLIEDYAVGVTHEIEVGDTMTRGGGLMRGAGYPVLSPCLDLSEVGAGGGSVAWIDTGGVLRVGPASTGSDPGPACYGLGGEEATVTDAHVVLGYLNPTAIAGGSRQIHKHLADAAIGRLGQALGAGPQEAAYAVFSIANAQMRRAIRAVSVERGRDPRSFSLISFGGNGGIHAAALARELEMPEVIVPIAPGLFSGLGLLMSDIALSRSITHRQPVTDELFSESARRARDLTAEVRSILESAGHSPADIRSECVADVRYVGQSSTLPMPFDPHACVTGDLVAGFHAHHLQVFGHSAAGEPIETVSLRARAWVTTRRPTFAHMYAASEFPAPPTTDRSQREVHFGPASGRRLTPVIGRAQLAEHERSGPLLIEDSDTTVVVPPDVRARVDRSGSIVLGWDYQPNVR